MAKTTNHPPYEIDPWKADTTEPPSGLTFNPEIVETAGKPKQAPVPAEPTEGQLKIEESISRVDRFDNEMNALREQQEKVLAEVQENIDETNEKIKQLNDLEEQIKKQVGEYTEETDNYLRQSELLRGELQESKAKMEKAVNDASSAITAAENAQKALKAYQDGEAKRFREAINQAQVGVAKAADVNKQIESLRNSLGEEINKQISSNDTIAKIKSDNEALNSKMKDALDKSEQGANDAAKAIAKAQKGMDKAEEVSQQLSGLKDSLGGEIDKQIAVNKAIKEIQSDNKALGSRLDDVLKTSKQGVDDAAKAIEAIENNVEIGASLITVIPGTTRPYWTKDLSVGKEGAKDEYFYSDSFEVGIDGPLVKINPKLEYRLYLEAYGYDGESKITITFVDKDGKDVSTKVISYEEKNGKKERVVKAGFTQFPLYDEILTPTWKSIDYAIEFLGGVEFVKLGRIRFNAYSEEKKKQCIRNFRIEPLIPTQADVDRAQNEAIGANTKAIEANTKAVKAQDDINKANKEFQSLQKEFNTSQTKLNKTYDAMWDAQGKRNLLQEGIDSAQTKASEANSKAIKANSLALEQQKAINKANAEFQGLQKEFNTSQTKLNKTYDAMWDAQGKRNLLQEGIDKSQNEAVIASARASLTPELGNSLVPYATPSDQDILDGKAVWNMPHYALKGNAGWIVSSEVPARGKPTEVSDIGWAIGTKNGDGTMGYHGPDTPCVPGGIYNVEFWGFANGAGSQMYIELRETGTGNHAVEKGTGDTSGGSYIIGGMELKVGWHKYTGTIKIKEGVRSVYINNWYWNHPQGSKSNVQLITGLKIDLAVPSVWDVVNANTLALENQKAINDKQEGIAAAHTKAIDSNRKAIRALAKIDLGGSLLAYMPLTDAEIQKGITREHVPAWAANATNVLDGSKLSGTTSAKGYVFLSGTGGSAKGEEVYAQVSQGTQYLLDIDLFTPTYMAFNIVFKTSNSKIKNPVKKFYWTEDDEYGGLKTTSYLTNTNKVTISTNGGRIPILVEFQDNVEDIYIEKLEWTRTNSVTVKSFSLAPYTPSQASIDARQNKALEGLQLAQKLQTQMTKKNSEFAKEIYKASTGIIHLRREESAGSSTHGVGFVMPYRNTIFSIYARTDFHGNLIILVDYATGLGDGLRIYRLDSSSLHLALNPNNNVSSQTVKNELFKGEDHYKYYNLNIAGGDVENIVVFVDHLDWNRH